MLREVVVTLKEEQACLKLWFEDKSVNEDVRRGIEISLKKISEALGKLAALGKETTVVKQTIRQTCRTQRTPAVTDARKAADRERRHH